MKSLKESILVQENVLRGKLSEDDAKNYKIIAKAIRNITSELSDWMEEDSDNEVSPTGDLAHNLSDLASLLEAGGGTITINL